jgi:hypothetical protein
MSGVMINGSIGSRIGQRIDSRNVFEWNNPKGEFDQTRGISRRSFRRDEQARENFSSRVGGHCDRVQISPYRLRAKRGFHA